ncbi:hypothetical protein OQA88_1067 [Cercophora sp. LCS_1]
MHLVLTGATGLVGTSVLDAMLKTPAITKISILSRRPVQMAQDSKDARVNVIIHADFEQYDGVMDKLRDATGVVWALGVSQNSVGKEDYVRITKSYALAAASAFQSIATPSKPVNFVFVSGAGATLTPGRFTPLFGRVKGETELALAEMRKTNPGFKANTVRPAFVDWVGHEAVQKYMPPQGLMLGGLGRVLHGAVSAGLFRGSWSPTESLGRALVDLAMGTWKGEELKGKGVEVLEGGFEVVENVGFRRLAGLDG